MYLFVVDYFSRFVEIVKMTSTTSSNAITHLKTIFSHQVISAALITDNGHHYSSAEWTSCHQHKDFNILKVLIIFSQMDKPNRWLSLDHQTYLALLNYRETALPWHGRSPQNSWWDELSEQMLPNTQCFSVKVALTEEFRGRERKYRDDQKSNYDKYYRTGSLPEFPQNTPV